MSRFSRHFIVNAVYLSGKAPSSDPFEEQAVKPWILERNITRFLPHTRSIGGNRVTQVSAFRCQHESDDCWSCWIASLANSDCNQC